MDLNYWLKSKSSSKHHKLSFYKTIKFQKKALNSLKQMDKSFFVSTQYVWITINSLAIQIKLLKIKTYYQLCISQIKLSKTKNKFKF